MTETTNGEIGWNRYNNNVTNYDAHIALAKNILFQGRQCERCSAGYVGDPYTPGDTCRQDQGKHFIYI